MLNPSVIIPQFDAVTGEVIGSMEAKTSINSQDIVRYRSRKTGCGTVKGASATVRIIGIAPIIEKKDDEGNSQGLAPLFWLYYPSAVMYSPTQNATTTPTMRSDAPSRRFSKSGTSRVTSSRRPTSLTVPSTTTHKASMLCLNQQRIKDELFTIEHDLWHY